LPVYDVDPSFSAAKPKTVTKKTVQFEFPPEKGKREDFYFRRSPDKESDPIVLHGNVNTRYGTRWTLSMGHYSTIPQISDVFISTKPTNPNFFLQNRIQKHFFEEIPGHASRFGSGTSETRASQIPRSHRIS